MEMEDLVLMARLQGAWGFRGWVRVAPLETGEVLEHVRRWTIVSPSGEKREVQVTGIRRHGAGFIAKWEGCETKEEADAVRGRVAVRRADFPEAGEDAVWAVDLPGCAVVNLEGELLGTVTDLATNGAQDLLVVGFKTDEGEDASFMIPYVKEVYIVTVDTKERKITVDWAADWR